MYYLRIKDSSSSYAHSEGSRFTLDNPYDFLIYYGGKLFPMELKSTKSSSFSIQIENEQGKNIKTHQIMALSSASKIDGVIPGFVLDFRRGNTYWLHVDKLKNFLKTNSKKSINENDVIKYGGVLIDKKLLKVNYRYDILNLIKFIMEKY